MVINLVSTSKLKNDFIKYEKDELEKLSAAECDSYIESLVIEFMKPFKYFKLMIEVFNFLIIDYSFLSSM